MSHSRRVFGTAVFALAAAAVAGCCGGAPSHQCNFASPPTPPRDAAAETPPLLCGTLACGDGTVCCLQKIAPFTSCVAPADYQAMGCEQMEVECSVPADCPFGLVCCDDTTKISCKPDQLCPGDENPTYRICAANSDCPRIAPTCTSAGGGQDAGTISISICL